MRRFMLYALVLSALGLSYFVSRGESSSMGSQEGWGSRYHKAGNIKVLDPKMGAFGSVDSDMALMHFNLVDIAKFCGHLCGGSTSGFMMTKKALERLYGNGEIPVRGDILLTSKKKGEPMEVAAYIIGASDEDHHGHQSWIIDKSIESKKGSLVLVFERVSTGKRVQVTWDKAGTMKEHVGDLERFEAIKMKALHGGRHGDAESKEFATLVNSLVMKIIDGGVKYETVVLHEGVPGSRPDKGCQCHGA